MSRWRGSAVVTSESTRTLAAAAMSAMARSNAASFAFEGTLKPLSLRTNCNEASRISTSVAGGSKLKRVLMFLHMARLTTLARLAAIGDGLHQARAEAHRRHQVAGAAVVEPLFGRLAGHEGARKRLRHGLERLVVVRGRTEDVPEQRLPALVEH